METAIMRSRLPLVLVTIGLLLPIPLSAQEPPTVVPWQRVRVTAPAAGLVREVFALLDVSADSIVLVRQPSPARLDTVRLPRTALQTLEVSVHRRSGALVGFCIGLAVGAVVGAEWAKNNDSGGGNFAPNFDNAFGILLRVGAGGLAGAAGGRLIQSDKTWRAVPLDRLRIAVSPQPASRLSFGAGPSF